MSNLVSICSQIREQATQATSIAAILAALLLFLLPITLFGGMPARHVTSRNSNTKTKTCYAQRLQEPATFWENTCNCDFKPKCRRSLLHVAPVLSRFKTKWRCSLSITNFRFFVHLTLSIHDRFIAFQCLSYMDTSEETSLTWTPCPATPAPASPLALVSWYDLSRYRTRQDESFARVWRMGKSWAHLVTWSLFFSCCFFAWIFVSVVGCGGKFWKQAWDEKGEGQLILSFTEPFPRSNWCTTVPCTASTKSTEREGVGDWDRTLLMWLYIETISSTFNALSGCIWIDFDESWWTVHFSTPVWHDSSTLSTSSLSGAWFGGGTSQWLREAHIGPPQTHSNGVRKPKSPRTNIPSRELTYPPKMAFWRWFSFSQGGIC